MRKNLKISVRGAIFVLLINTSMAQQDPMFTYYLQNPIAFNPAIAGTTSGLNLSLLSRHQWVGMDGAPASYSFGAHTPYIKQNMGLGLNVMTDIKCGSPNRRIYSGKSIVVCKFIRLS